MEPIYKIWAQTITPNETLIVFHQLGKLEKIIRSAKDLQQDKKLLERFAITERTLIHFIAETE